MSEAPDTDVPDMDMDVPDPTGLDGYDHDADYDQAIQAATDDEVTTDAAGNTVLAPGVDPLAVMERAEHGITWPSGAAPMPAGFTALTPEERTDWLIDHGWPGVITGDGYPVAADPWGDPIGDPTNKRLTVEPVIPPTKGRSRMGGRDASKRALQDVKDAANHGDSKGSGGGKGGKERKRILGMGPRGTGIAGTGITINLVNLAGAFSGWLSPSASVPVASGNRGALVESGRGGR